MGSLFGARLAEAGQAVTLLDIDDAHLGAIRSHGLRLQTAAPDRWVTNLAVSRPEQAGAQPDLIIVFTKSMHTRAALTSLRHAIGPGTYLLTLQNGLGNVAKLREFVPLERILAGVTTWPADLVGPGHVRSHGEGAIRMMSADGAVRPIVGQVVDALANAGLRCIADPDVWAAIWEKVAFNAALNTLCAVLGCTVDQLDLTPDGRRLALSIALEVVSVARARGIDANPASVEASVIHAIENHRGHQPSMLQDILAGRRTEIESIGGAVVAEARAAGVAVPDTACLLHLVRLAEARAVTGA